MCCPPPVLSNIAFEVGVCASSCASHAYISKRFWERPPQDISNSADAVATSTGPCWCDGLPLGPCWHDSALHSHAIDAGVRYETSEMRDVPALFLGALSIQQLYSWMLSIVVCVCVLGVRDARVVLQPMHAGRTDPPPPQSRIRGASHSCGDCRRRPTSASDSAAARLRRAGLARRSAFLQRRGAAQTALPIARGHWLGHGEGVIVRLVATHTDNNADRISRPGTRAKCWRLKQYSGAHLAHWCWLPT